MKVSSKNIIVKNSFKDLNLKSKAKDLASLKSNSKIKFLSSNFSKINSIADNKIKSIDLLQNVNFIKAGSFEYIPKINIGNKTLVVHKLNERFNFFSCSLDLSKFINIYEGLPNYRLNESIDYTNKDLSTFFENTIYEYENDNVPYYYKNQQGYKEDVKIITNYTGVAYLPEYNYNGIGVFQQREGYNVRLNNKNLYFKAKSEYLNIDRFKFSDYNDGFNTSLNEVKTNQVRYNFENSWYLLGAPFENKVLASEYFKEVLDNDNVVIIKDVNGKAIIPDFAGYGQFFGFEYLEPFQAYQIKFKNL